MKLADIISWYFFLWFITIPVSIYILYHLITELLDLVLNTQKIYQLLKYSDHLEIDQLDIKYQELKTTQAKLNSSNLMEMKRQIDYARYKKHDKNIRLSKELADSFKFRK